MNSTTLFGIQFPEETLASVIQKSQSSWQSHTRLRIATVNPEFLVAAEKNADLKKNLEQAEVLVVDGVGVWAALRLQGWQGSRLTGVTLLEALLKVARQENRRVLVILKEKGLSALAKTKEVLLQKYPGLKLTVMYDTELTNLSHLTYDCIFIATGIPTQEYLAQQIQEGVVIGVGGAIDFLTGAQKRAPKVLQAIGLEWLWRFLLQPSRLGRIGRAVLVFPYLLLLATIRR